MVGLGNPEPRYQRTRHNAGQLVVEALAGQLDVRFSAKYAGRFADGRAPSGRVSLLIPTTYMNLSGRSVGPAMGSLGLTPDQVLVVHDEIDLPFGALKGKVGGGHGGHNGLRSIQEALGGGGFPRIRVGVGRPTPEQRMDEAAWVLSQFSEPADEVDRLLAGALTMVHLALDEGIDTAIARVHAREPGARHTPGTETETE